jgi:hypothetical protein
VFEELTEAESPCRSCNRIWFDKGYTDRFDQKVKPEEDPKPDAINPSHYKLPGGLEAIQITRHLNRNRAAAVEYVLRAGRKTIVEGQEVEDLKKARWAIDDEIQRLTGIGDHAK